MSHFCGSFSLPVLSTREINAYMNQAAKQVENDLGRTFLSDETEVTFARTRRVFLRFLFKAKDMKASGRTQGFHHLVGLCLEHLCIATKRRPIPCQEEEEQEDLSSPPAKRALRDDGETRCASAD